MATILVNPMNKYEINISNSFLWCFLFGSLYFAYKGVWGHAILSFILALFTCGISWLIYPFFAERAIVDYYQKLGWQIKGLSSKEQRKNDLVDLKEKITQDPFGWRSWAIGFIVFFFLLFVLLGILGSLGIIGK